MSKLLDLNKQMVKGTRRFDGATWGGVFLLQVGSIALLTQFAVHGNLDNWWALFILAPALIAFNVAWLAYSRSNSWTGWLPRIALSFCVIVLTVALLFLFELDWGKWWPAMIIVPCSTLLANSLAGSHRPINPILRSVVSQIAWMSGSATLLGVIFLVDQLGIVDLYRLLGGFQWWGVFILLPGLSALLNAVILYQQHSRSSTTAAVVFLTVGAMTCATAVVALLHLDWDRLNIVHALTLIGMGVLLLAGRLFTPAESPQ